MSDHTTIRRCVICGSAERVEANHVGGRNHIAWFTSPFCGSHHDEYHTMLRQAGVDLRYTPDPVERIRRAMAADLVFGWMLNKKLQIEIEKRRNTHL